MNDKKVKTYGIVLGVLLFLLLAVGITYAVLAWKSSNISILGNAECLDINYVKGNNISDEILLFDESQIINNNKITIKNGMGLTNVTAGIKSNCTINGYITINLNVSSLNSTFTSSGSSNGALKYVLASYDPSTYTTVNTTTLNNISFNILEKGSITETGTIKIYEDQLSNTKTKGYLLILYIDGDLVTNYTGDNITASLEAVVTQGRTVAAGYIKSLFTPNTTVTNNGIAYDYDTTHNLMQDIGGNIRYYGANPNNYIDIGDIYESDVTKGKWEELGAAPFTTEDECKAFSNCSINYSALGFSSEDECNSQLPTMVQQQFGMTIEEFNNTYCVVETIPKGTPILYRIIGVFGDKIKLIRNEVIGAYSWDNKDTSTGAADNYGKNDWTDARLMKLLNPGYESETTGGSLYYNSGSGSCYSGENNATKTCDFTSIGLSESVKSKIAEVTWNLGGWNSTSVYSDTIYEKERGTTVYSGRPTTWTGKIALPYPSDYGYAADLGSCTVQLGSYDNSTCTSANWMKTIFTNHTWLLTPGSSSSDTAWRVDSSGIVNYSYGTCDASGVAPVFYLGSEQVIESGTGTNSDPYRLSVS